MGLYQTVGGAPRNVSAKASIIASLSARPPLRVFRLTSRIIYRAAKRPDRRRNSMFEQRTIDGFERQH
jgi:hypothetical protein